MKTVLYTGGTLPPQDRERLENLGYQVKISKADLTEGELINALQGIDAYIIGGVEKATRRAIESATNLKIIAFSGVGYENFVDASAATELGIAVTNTPEANSGSVAEFAIALMLDSTRRITFLIDKTRQGEWQELRTWALNGKTLGIIGLGAIGKKVAHIAKEGLGMKVIYHSLQRKVDLEQSMGITFSSLEDLLSKSDVVSIHAKYSPQTINLLGEKELAQMKTSAVLINTARAELVEPHSLYKSLSTEKIASAAFDGYYQEPVPPKDKDPFGLIGLPDYKFLVTPHTAYLTDDALSKMTEMCIESVDAALQGRIIPRVVNPDYKKSARR